VLQRRPGGLAGGLGTPEPVLRAAALGRLGAAKLRVLVPCRERQLGDRPYPLVA